MNIWEELGIKPTTDKKEIRRAYAKQIAIYHPTEHPKKAQKLHEAYMAAMKLASPSKEFSLTPTEYKPQSRQKNIVEVKAREDIIETPVESHASSKVENHQTSYEDETHISYDEFKQNTSEDNEELVISYDDDTHISYDEFKQNTSDEDYVYHKRNENIGIIIDDLLQQYDDKYKEAVNYLNIFFLKMDERHPRYQQQSTWRRFLRSPYLHIAMQRYEFALELAERINKYEMEYTVLRMIKNSFIGDIDENNPDTNNLIVISAVEKKLSDNRPQDDSKVLTASATLIIIVVVLFGTFILNSISNSNSNTREYQRLSEQAETISQLQNSFPETYEHDIHNVEIYVTTKYGFDAEIVQEDANNMLKDSLGYNLGIRGNDYYSAKTTLEDGSELTFYLSWDKTKQLPIDIKDDFELRLVELYASKYGITLTESTINTRLAITDPIENYVWSLEPLHNDLQSTTYVQSGGTISVPIDTNESSFTTATFRVSSDSTYDAQSLLSAILSDRESFGS